jgi:hypothetical protein
MNLTPVNNSDTPAPTNKKVIGQYQMQLIPGFGKPTVEKVDITEPLSVQDALEAAGAPSKFRGMKITLGRVVKDAGQLLKLPIDYEVSTKSIRPEQNYQVLPGDTITVSPNRSGSIEKVIESLTGGIN